MRARVTLTDGNRGKTIVSRHILAIAVHSLLLAHACGGSGPGAALDGGTLELTDTTTALDAARDQETASTTDAAESADAAEGVDSLQFTDASTSPGMDALMDTEGGPDDATDTDSGALVDATTPSDTATAKDTEEEAGPTCPFAPFGAPRTATFGVVGLDIWAQEVPYMSTSLWTMDGSWTPSIAYMALSTELCGPVTLGAGAEAPLHVGMTATITYDGQGEEDSLTVEVDGGDGAAVLTTGLIEIEGEQVRGYTLWLGLAHTHFAVNGPPARRGNLVTLLRDGEETWATAQADLLFADELVTAATWWWSSDVELYRDPWLHPYLTPAERWANTAIGTLEAIGLTGVQSKVLINQFYTQDGLLSWITSDDWINAAATTPDNGIEMLGAANEAAGVFEVLPTGSSFADHLVWGGPLGEETVVLGSVESDPWLSPQTVDLTELPAGLGWFDVPLASWHQKFLTVDQEVAYIGGMNVKTTDWDTHEHRVYEERRMELEADLQDRLNVLDKVTLPDFHPRKDYMVRIEGPSVADAVELFKRRWDAQLIAGVENADLATPFAASPVPAPFDGGVQAQLVTTMPAPFDETSIADTMLRAISRAEDYIYIEDQYFRSPILADAIIDRMVVDDDLVLIVITSPVDEWVDPGCWQTHLQHELLSGLFPNRYGMFQLRSFDWVDTNCGLCIDEVLGTFMPMSLHSKIVIIDDLYLQIGSCNHNNRGLLYEGEAAVAVVDADWVADARHLVFENILGGFYEPDTVGNEWLIRFQGAAFWNDWIYEDWEASGFDLDLDGEPVPADWIPDGFLYSLDFGAPSNCFFESVGEDVTQAY